MTDYRGNVSCLESNGSKKIVTLVAILFLFNEVNDG